MGILKYTLRTAIVLFTAVFIFGVFSWIGDLTTIPVQAAATATISVSPASGSPGGTVTVTGTDYKASESVTVYYDNQAMSSVTASGGNWSISFKIPASPSGTSHYINAVGASSGTVSAVFTVIPYIWTSVSSGLVGKSLTVYGSGFTALESGVTVTWDGDPVGANVNASSTGSWSSTFPIPSCSGGNHTISADGPVTSSLSLTSRDFTVKPSISLNQLKAAPGTVVTISGAGFLPGDKGINVTFDGNTVASGSFADQNGAWTDTFTVPPAKAGNHTINASSISTSSSSITPVSLIVTASISLDRTSGASGSSVKVSGSGFAANEKNIVVTFDGKTAGSPTSADGTGNWSLDVAIPPTNTGSHIIGAKGQTTPVSSVPTVTFTSLPTIKLDKTSSPAGTTVNISGEDFAVRETSIAVLFDGQQVTGDITADARGSWNASFNVPYGPAGNHSIKVSGSQTLESEDSNFRILPGLSIKPADGYVGSTVNLTGTGLAANSDIQVLFDDLPFREIGAVTTDNLGDFSKSFTIPRAKADSHTIKVIDNINNTASAQFNIGNAVPFAPVPISPADGARIGISGDVTPTLSWTEVEDPNGVTYNLQIDDNPEFSHPFINETGIEGSRYTLPKTDELHQGTFYWRVKAVNGASVESPWSKTYVIQSGVMPASILIMIVVLVLVAVAAGILFGYILPTRRRKAAQAAALSQPAEIVIPEIVNAEYRALETEGSAKQLSQPLRLALPPSQETTEEHILSTADQARLEVISDFINCMPLIEPDNSINWLVDLAQPAPGDTVTDSATVFPGLVRGEIQVRYEPDWMQHPTFLELQALLEGQPVLQELDSYIEAVNSSVGEIILFLQDINKDVSQEIIWDALANGGSGFISGIYSDSLNWFLGKYLLRPADKDYQIKSEGNEHWELFGEKGTPFEGLLIKVSDEKEILQMRSLHIKLRQYHRNNEKARQIVSTIAQLRVQRARVMGVLKKIRAVGKDESLT